MAKQAGDSWKIRYLDEPGVVELTYWGKLTGEIILEAVAARLQVGKEYDCTKFLIDTVEATADESVINALFERVTVSFNAERMPKESRIAVLESRDEEYQWFLQFYERLTTARGWNVKRFLDRESALEWLAEP